MVCAVGGLRISAWRGEPPCGNGCGGLPVMSSHHTEILVHYWVGAYCCGLWVLKIVLGIFDLWMWVLHVDVFFKFVVEI